MVRTLPRNESRMPQSNTQSLNFDSNDRDAQIDEVVSEFVDSTTDLADALDAPDGVVEQFVESAEGLAQLVSDTAHEASDNADKTDRLEDDLQDTQEHAGKERAELSGRISDVEDRFDDEKGGVNGGKTTLQRDELTPIEKLSQAADIEKVTESVSVQRAVSLFKNLPQWSSKTQKGYVLKPSDNPLKLLEADRNESLCWKQFYRAAECLETLSEGSVTFVDSDRHGKMVVLHEQSEAYERVTSGALSSSSVGAKG